MDRNLLLALTLSATFQCLAQTPEPFEVRRAEPVFEELPELKASEILKPELLKGPHYVVRDPVPTASGMNQFTIDSDFGVFEADGNEMLLQRLMNQIHQKTPIARIVMVRDFPICVAKDGTIIVALQWDYAAWTSGAASFTDDVQKLAAKSGQSAHVFVGLSGEISPRLREELEKRGMTVQDRLVPGPLK